MNYGEEKVESGSSLDVMLFGALRSSEPRIDLNETLGHPSAFHMSSLGVQPRVRKPPGLTFWASPAVRNILHISSCVTIDLFRLFNWLEELLSKGVAVGM